MSVRVTVRELQEQLPDLLDRAVDSGEAYIVERNGEDYAVIISARQWRRRTIGRRLDALGLKYRLAREKQAQAEELLSKNQHGRLARAERRELDALLRECDDILLRRAEALDTMR